MNRDTSSSSGSTTPLSKLFQFTQEHTPPALTRATYSNVTIGVVQKTLSRGCRYRELALLDLIRQELPSDTYPALQPHLLVRRCSKPFSPVNSLISQRQTPRLEAGTNETRLTRPIGKSGTPNEARHMRRNGGASYAHQRLKCRA
ncbi:hypothetical protein DFH06DRAFT_1131906 [Mycena polygramma]|nr:hypothetical protein DFH06DRAFT_1131906 [Mycena polygramma]